MGKLFDKALGYAVAAAFVFGIWSFGHFILRLSDTVMMAFAWWMLFSLMGGYINKLDAETS